MKKPLLRLALPPLRVISPTARAAYALVDAKGNVQTSGEMALAELGAGWADHSIQALLHPSDVVLTRVLAPPLSGARMAAAVASAAEPLVLGDSSAAVLAYGPRAADGEVPLAWVGRQAFEDAVRALAGCGLTAEQFFPTPFFLPVTESGWTAWTMGDCVVVRTGAQTGFIYPLEGGKHSDPARSPGAAALSAAIGLAAPSSLTWVGSEPDWWPQAPGQATARLPDSQRWSGPAASWSLNYSTRQPMAARNWQQPLAWVAIAAALWMVGLNLYALHLAREGAALQARMSQRVKEAFPSLPSVFNPLQQARQQRDAQLAVAQQAAGADFAMLTRLSAESLPFAAGQVRELRYVSGELTLRLADTGSRPAGTDEPSWMQGARQSGLSVEAVASGWRVRHSAPDATPEIQAAQPSAQAPADSKRSRP